MQTTEVQHFQCQMDVLFTDFPHQQHLLRGRCLQRQTCWG